MRACRNPQEAFALFDALADVDIAFMTGAWEGQEFPTGHPADGALQAYGWRGKRIDDAERVHPLVFASGGRTFAPRARWLGAGVPLLLRWPWLKSPAAARVLRHALPLIATRRSQARLRMLHFRGRLTAAMVYDELPILDVFRAADRDTVLGVMDLKGMDPPFFFLLRRLPPQGG